MFCRKVSNQLRGGPVYFADCCSSDPRAFVMASFQQRNIGQFHFGQDPRRNFQFLDWAWKDIFVQIFVAFVVWLDSLPSRVTLSLSVFSGLSRLAENRFVESTHLHPRSSPPPLKPLRHPPF